MKVLINNFSIELTYCGAYLIDKVPIYPFENPNKIIRMMKTESSKYTFSSLPRG